MDMKMQLWSSWALLLLVALLSVSYVTHGGDPMEQSGLRSRRMVGGTLAPVVPWHAMVFLSNDFLGGGYGGGALISDRWVLTSGRTLFVRKGQNNSRDDSPLIPKVYLGISGLAQANKSTEHPVEKVVLHPAFQAEDDWDNDLALIKLKDPVVMSDKITPIPLPTCGQSLQNKRQGAIAGWGWGVYLTQAEWLKSIVLPLTNQCESLYQQNPRFKSDRMLCTGPSRHGENVCDKDAGGALVVMDEGDVFAAGILSYDRVCRERSHAVYTKVQPYLPWIHGVMRGDTETSMAQRNASFSKMLNWSM